MAKVLSMPAWASRRLASVAPARPQVGRPNDWATWAWAARPRLPSGAPKAIRAVAMSRMPTLPLMHTGQPGLRSWARVIWIRDSAVTWTTVPARVMGAVAPGWAVAPGTWGMNRSAAIKMRSTTSRGNTKGEIASG
jgi:hypothetical protein